MFALGLCPRLCPRPWDTQVHPSPASSCLVSSGEADVSGPSPDAPTPFSLPLLGALLPHSSAARILALGGVWGPLRTRASWGLGEGAPVPRASHLTRRGSWKPAGSGHGEGPWIPQGISGMWPKHWKMSKKLLGGSTNSRGKIPGYPATVPPLDPPRAPHHSAHPCSTPFSTPKQGCCSKPNVHNGILLSNKKERI